MKHTYEFRAANDEMAMILNAIENDFVERDTEPAVRAALEKIWRGLYDEWTVNVQVDTELPPDYIDGPGDIPF